MSDKSKLQEPLEDAWTKRREGHYDEDVTLIKQVHKLCDDADHDILGRIFHVYMQFVSDHANYSKAIEFSQKSLRYYIKSNNLDSLL